MSSDTEIWYKTKYLPALKRWEVFQLRSTGRHKDFLTRKKIRTEKYFKNQTNENI